jgi:hypothetical protein
MTTNPAFDALLPVKSGAVPQNLKLTLAIDMPTPVGGCRICGEVAGGRRECVEAFGQNPTVELPPFVRAGFTYEPIGGAKHVEITGCADRHRSYPINNVGETLGIR